MALYSPPELSNRAGAEKVEFMIREYWRDRGFVIQTKCEPVFPQNYNNGGFHQVRSDMINGLPLGAPPEAVTKLNR